MFEYPFKNNIVSLRDQCGIRWASMMVECVFEMEIIFVFVSTDILGLRRVIESCSAFLDLN